MGGSTDPLIWGVFFVGGGAVIGSDPVSWFGSGDFSDGVVSFLFFGVLCLSPYLRYYRWGLDVLLQRAGCWLYRT